MTVLLIALSLSMTGRADAIRGGIVDTTNLYDAVVQVVTTKPDGSTSGCSGTLIADDVVLTAAHCACNPCEAPYSGVACATRTTVEFVDATLADSNIRGDEYFSGDMIAHPGFCVNNEFDDDYAIVRLDVASHRKVRVDPIPIEDSWRTNITDTYSTLVGWGRTNEGSSTANCDAWATGRTYGDALYTEYKTYGNPVEGATLSFADPNVGSCLGDSGGPAINGRGHIHGVSSRGDSTAFSSYASTLGARDWIKETAGIVGLYVDPLAPYFFAPISGIDWCLHFGTDCGAPAAHEFCDVVEGTGWVAQDFAKAEDVPPTWLLGTGQTCTSPDCDSFEYVRCADTTRTTADPTFKGERLDFCRYDGGLHPDSCGQPAADAWCRWTYGGDWYSTGWVEEEGVGRTRIIATSAICDGSYCDGFAEISCAWSPPDTAIPDDADFDGVSDAVDNCPDVVNPLQQNSDTDTLGDACDDRPTVTDVCIDGLDNDGDGLTDAQDPGCLDAYDFSERQGGLACDDGWDNDYDGATDYPDDPKCFSVYDATEGTQCSDLEDNDLDGLFNDSDPDCTDVMDDSEWHLARGDIVVADWNAKLIRVHPASGRQTVLYRGAPLQNPIGVAVTADGDVLVADQGADALFRLDSGTGRMTQVGTTGSLSSPRYMTLDAGGNALVCNQNGWVVRVDLATGVQTLLDSSAGISWCEGISASPTGDIVVADRNGGALVELDPATGAMVSHRPGGSFTEPIGVVHMDADTVLVTDDGTGELYVVDLTRDTRGLVSRGQLFGRPRGVAMGPEGEIYVADVDAGLLRVDWTGPASANQVSVTDGDMGTPLGVAVYSTPACSDGIDNDGNGLADAADPGCADPMDDAEYGLTPGDILVADAAGKVIRIDPADSAATILVHRHDLDGLSGVAVESDRNLILAQTNGARLLRLHTDTGEVQVVSEGGYLVEPREVLVEGSGRLLVADSGTPGVIAVDPDTGAQALLVDDTGNRFQRLEGLAIGPDGFLYLSDSGGIPEILKIDPKDPLNHVVLTQDPSLEVPRRLIFDRSGDLIVVDAGTHDQLYRIDPETGAILETIAEDNFLIDSYAVAEDAAGRLLVTTRGSTITSRLVVIDPSDGSERIISAPYKTLEVANGLAVIRTRCDDGIDNDGDGLTDLADAECIGPWDDFEATRCGLGYDVAFTLPMIMWLRRAVRRRRARRQP